MFYAIIPVLVGFGLFIGIAVWSMYRYNRKSADMRDRMEAELASSWREKVLAITQNRVQEWWHKQPSMSAARRLIHVQYIREDGTQGHLTVAQQEDTGRDDPGWAMRYDIADFIYMAVQIQDVPPAFDDVLTNWSVGMILEKPPGAFYPRPLVTDRKG